MSLSSLLSYLLLDLNYVKVLILMAIESSIFPLPSELVIPAAVHRYYFYHSMTLLGIILFGTLGSWLGASIMYWLSRGVGRPLLNKYGKYILITPKKITGAERWFRNYGDSGIFVSRLLPVIRHLIGIPAGIAKMNYLKYSAYTLLGSLVWCSILTWIGLQAVQDEALMAGQIQAVSIWLTGAILGLGVLYYVFVHRKMRKGNSK
jgi:membrane protein DedA with SNARE-associated domain